MSEFKFLPVPAEEYDALGIGPDTVLETRLTEERVLIVRALTDADLDEFACDGDCDECPVAEIDCDGECFSCPCYASCDDSDFEPRERPCRSHGARRED